MIHNGEHCECQPTIIPVKRNDGSIGYVIAHVESELPPESDAERATRIFEAMEQVRNNEG